MATSPSCLLYVSFICHLTGFTALICGYSTPYWTLVKLSTGEVKAQGLLVSCYKGGCRMVDLNETRTVFTIVFAMCTSAIILSVFILQALALAVCNNSCRSRNVGAGMSYPSLVTALLIAATLALYELDLASEDRSEVTKVTIGWSRFVMMASSGAFLLGTVLNIADYVRRNNSVWADQWQPTNTSEKKVQIRNKMIEAHAESYEHRAKVKGESFRQNSGAEVEKDGEHFSFRRASNAVGAVVKIADAQNEFGKSRIENKSVNDNKSNKNVIRVNELLHGAENSNGHSCKPIKEGVAFGDDRNIKMAVDNTKRNRLTKTVKVNSMEEEKCLPTVEEVNMKDEDLKLKKPKVSVLENIGKGQSLEEKSHSEKILKNRIGSKSSLESSIKSTVGSHLTTEMTGKGKHNSENKNKINSDLRVTPHGRRGSAVEEAILGVSHLLDDVRDVNSSKIESSGRENVVSAARYSGETTHRHTREYDEGLVKKCSFSDISRQIMGKSLTQQRQLAEGLKNNHRKRKLRLEFTE